MVRVEWQIDLESLVRELNRTIKAPTLPLGIEITDAKKNSILLIGVDHRGSERCWYDHHPLAVDSRAVVHCPLSFSQPDTYKATGSFCSFECALAYANANRKDPAFRDSVNLLRQLFSISHPDQDFPSPAGADYRSLKAYGGHLDISEFRNGTHVISSTPNWADLTTLGRVGR